MKGRVMQERVISHIPQYTYTRDNRVFGGVTVINMTLSAVDEVYM